MSASRVLYLLFAVFALCSSINDYNSFNARRRINPNYTPERSDDRDREYSVNAVFSPEDKNLRPGNSKEKEDLYEAYNLLHTLAQDFHKPFDAPAVIVIGHQTSGKSALIEALMGFQFNQVGGGTKTRRPVALRMQYNPSCTTPLCFLTLENGKEEQRSLADIQAYIEAENKRLERDTSRSFDAREINIRMEYRYCPNMIVIDTPGMLHPPKGRSLSPQQKAHQQAAREAENLVLSKIRCQDYIILCVEDTTDWRHATTRNIVMQADPMLSRTVLVTTKLDTKLPQFSEASDLEDFLKAPLIHQLYSQLLGGPFFSSVPSGRVGISKDFDTNEAFVTALQIAERRDRSNIINRMGPIKARNSLTNVGVSRLRTFLEARVEDSYRKNIAKIVPLLQSELRVTESKLAATEAELNALSLERLKVSANQYREQFSRELVNCLQGTIRVSPEQWGETLEGEQVRGGTFLPPDQVSVAAESWSNAVEREVDNRQHRLFGGAQYHRAMKEFAIAVRHMRTNGVTEDEIANAAGMGDTHNGVNFMRAACVISMEKAQESFDPMLESLRHRAVHIMKRMFPIVESMVTKGSMSGKHRSIIETYNRPFQDLIRAIYDKFVEERIEDCLEKCRDDLNGMTRFVTWDIEDKGGSSTLYKMLPTPNKMVQVYNVQLQKKKEEELRQEAIEPDAEEEEEDESDAFAERMDSKNRRKKRGGGREDSATASILDDWESANTKEKRKQSKNKRAQKKRPALPEPMPPAPMSEGTMVQADPKTAPDFEDDAQLTDYHQMVQLTEEMLGGNSNKRTSALVTSLVHFITSSWRNHFARSTTMKFNCFFLMPFMDHFPVYLRNELDALYDGSSDRFAALFDVAETRRALQSRRQDLLAECAANSKLQKRFDQISEQLRSAGNTENGDNDAPPGGGDDMYGSDGMGMNSMGRDGGDGGMYSDDEEDVYGGAGGGYGQEAYSGGYDGFDQSPTTDSYSAYPDLGVSDSSYPSAGTGSMGMGAERGDAREAPRRSKSAGTGGNGRQARGEGASQSPRRKNSDTVSSRKRRE